MVKSGLVWRAPGNRVGNKSVLACPHDGIVMHCRVIRGIEMRRARKPLASRLDSEYPSFAVQPMVDNRQAEMELGGVDQPLHWTHAYHIRTYI